MEIINLAGERALCSVQTDAEGGRWRGEERRSHRTEKTRRGGRERGVRGGGGGHEVTGVTQREAARARR